MAFAVPAGAPLSEFEMRVRKVCGWFDALNPYDQAGSILEFEDRNFATDSSRGKRLEPLYCAAISAKRYVLFNLDVCGEPIIRKARYKPPSKLLRPFTTVARPMQEGLAFRSKGSIVSSSDAAI
jgi:hypothetical protein